MLCDCEGNPQDRKKKTFKAKTRLDRQILISKKTSFSVRKNYWITYLYFFLNIILIIKNFFNINDPSRLPDYQAVSCELIKK